MTTYKSERGHKKLLVPVVALLLCATAMVGLGYAIALESKVINTGNEVAVDGLTATLTDDEGELLDANGFSANAIIGYYNIQDDKTNVYMIEGQTNLVLGKAKLNIHVTDEEIEEVSISYAIEWTEDPATAITHSLYVNGENKGTAGSEIILTLDENAATDDGQNFNIELKGNVTGSTTLDEEPLTVMPNPKLTYKITITVSPITPTED